MPSSHHVPENVPMASLLVPEQGARDNSRS